MISERIEGNGSDWSNWDPIGEAVKVLRKTTAMLDEMLGRWAEEGRKESWWRNLEGGHTFSSSNRTLSEPATPLQSQRIHTALIASKISFPSEMRKYRMVEQTED